MRLPISFLLLAAAACGGSSASSSGSPSADGTPPPADPAAPPPAPPGSNVAGPGEIDPTCGQSGFLPLANAQLQQIVASSPGAIMQTTLGSLEVDGAGSLQQVASGSRGWLVPAPNGGFYSVERSQQTTAVNVVRLGPDLKVDPSFAFDHANWSGSSLLIAVAADGSLYAAGNVGTNTSQEHVVLRHFLASGAVDAAFTPPDDQTPKGRGATAIVLAKDGGVLVEADDGFTPALLRFTPSGTLDASFGDHGDRVVDALGPRYGRALEVDEQGRILVLGMTNDDVQVARLLANGTLDGTFGAGGVATLTIPTSSKSDSSTEVNVEARAMFLDGRGRILVSAEESETPEGSFDATSGVIHLVRLDAAGKTDASFGKNGIATVQFGADAAVTRNLYGGAGFAALGDGRLLLGGEKVVATSAGTASGTSAVACVKM